MKVNQLFGCNALKEKKTQKFKVASDERLKTSHKLRTYSGISMNNVHEHCVANNSVTDKRQRSKVKQNKRKKSLAFHRKNFVHL